MDTQSANTHDPNIRHQYGEGEDDQHHEKISVLKKVKAKAKKIKDTIKKHGPGHNHDHGHEYQEGHIPDDHDLDEEDDDDEEELVQDPEVHGAPMYESAGAVKNVIVVSGQPEDLCRPGNTNERSRPFLTDPLASRDTGNYETKHNDPPNRTGLGGLVSEQQPRVSLGYTVEERPLAPQNTPLPTPSSQVKDAGPTKTFIHGEEEYAGQPKVNLQRPQGLEEDLAALKDSSNAFIPTNYETKVTDPTGGGGEATRMSPILHSLDKMKINDEQDSGRETLWEEDLAPMKDSSIAFIPTNYETKVADPTGGGEEATGMSPILHSLDKMKLHDEQDSEREENLPTATRPKATDLPFPTGTHDQFSPEPTPPLSTDPTHQEHPQSVDKPLNQGSYTEKISSATSAIADKAVSAKNIVASKLGYGDKNETTTNEPREGQGTTNQASGIGYGKGMASTVTEKVAGAGSAVVSKLHGPGTGTATEVKTTEVEQEQDKGVSMKSYIAEKLKPGEEDKVLSEVIKEKFQKPTEELENETRPRGKVTESEEVAKRLGTFDEMKEKESSGSMNSSTKTIVDTIRGTVGSWFGKGEVGQQETQQAQSPSSGNTDLSSSGGGRTLQESGN